VVFTPTPTYPIHPYSAIISGGDVRGVPVGPGKDFFENLIQATQTDLAAPKLLIISYPHNPTTEVVDPNFFEKIVDYAKEHDIMVIHDFAYADLTFDGYKAPSFSAGQRGQGGRALNSSPCPKATAWPGWRVGFCVGNPRDHLCPEAHQELSGLRHFSADPDRFHHCIGTRISQCVGNPGDLSFDRRDALITGLGPRRMGRPQPQGHHVRLGQNSGSNTVTWARWNFQVPDQGSPGGRIPGAGLR
jgi:alanine-synthesizing transaminase